VSAVARIADVLRLYNRLPGQVYITARTLDGFGSHAMQLPPAFEAGVPMPLLALLRDDWSIRIAPFTWDGGHWCALPMLVAIWRPSTTFLSAERRHIVTPEGEASVIAGLGAQRPPTVIVDAGPEVWAAWWLDEPITDATVARTALRTLAARVGGDADLFAAIGQTETDRVRLEALTLPLGGVIRNWNNQRPEHIRVLKVEPSRRYPLDALLSIGDSDVRHETTSGGEEVSGGRPRRAARA
jgi:hypothetical protein